VATEEAGGGGRSRACATEHKSASAQSARLDAEDRDSTPPPSAHQSPPPPKGLIRKTSRQEDGCNVNIAVNIAAGNTSSRGVELQPPRSRDAQGGESSEVLYVEESREGMGGVGSGKRERVEVGGVSKRRCPVAASLSSSISPSSNFSVPTSSTFPKTAPMLGGRGSAVKGKGGKESKKAGRGGSQGGGGVGGGGKQGTLNSFFRPM